MDTPSLVTLLLCLIISATAGHCPHHCKCLWRASKITVDCAGLLHQAVPDTINTDTQVLNMSKTALTTLESRLFISKNLTNLQRLYITQSPLTHIHSEVHRPPA